MRYALTIFGLVFLASAIASLFYPMGFTDIRGFYIGVTLALLCFGWSSIFWVIEKP